MSKDSCEWTRNIFRVVGNNSHEDIGYSTSCEKYISFREWDIFYKREECPYCGKKVTIQKSGYFKDVTNKTNEIFEEIKILQKRIIEIIEKFMSSKNFI